MIFVVHSFIFIDIDYQFSRISGVFSRFSRILCSVLRFFILRGSTLSRTNFIKNILLTVGQNYLFKQHFDFFCLPQKFLYFLPNLCTEFQYNVKWTKFWQSDTKHRAFSFQYFWNKYWNVPNFNNSSPTCALLCFGNYADV